MTHPIQQIGNTILLVMMDVEEGHEAEFDRWYNEEHLPERMEIPGYVSARRFKLEEGNGVLKYLCGRRLRGPLRFLPQAWGHSASLRYRVHLERLTKCAWINDPVVPRSVVSVPVDAPEGSV